MSVLYVDERYRGEHGIGRYSREVLTRLRTPWRPLGLDGTPHSPSDAFRSLAALQPSDLVYSPGYGALIRAPRHILTIHDLIQLRTPWPGRLKFAAYYGGPVRRTVRKAGVVLTVSETSAHDIREWVRDDSVRVVNAGNGCSAAFVSDGPAAAAVEPYVMFVGNMRWHKNIDVVLRALVNAPDVRLRAVLPQRELADAAARVAELGIADRVELLHGIDDDQLAALYRGAAATVMPSIDEGFGLPALESIACGVPVIFWSGCAAVSEVVGDRGWAVESPNDADAWADALAAAMGTVRRVESPKDAHDWDRVARVVSDVLENFGG